MNVRAFLAIDASDKYRTDHSQYAPGVPIEVVPFAYARVLQNLQHVLGSPNATLRMAKAKAGPVVTDNSNFVIDAPFSREIMMNPFTVRGLLPSPLPRLMLSCVTAAPGKNQNAHRCRGSWSVLQYGSGCVLW